MDDQQPPIRGIVERMVYGTVAELGYVDPRWDGTTAVEDGIQVLLLFPGGRSFHLEWDEGKYWLVHLTDKEPWYQVPLVGGDPLLAVLEAAVWATVKGVSH